MRKESAEVDLRIPSDGTLVIPNEVLKRLNISRGRKVHIRVTTSALSGQLKQRRVTEEEIDRISSVQLEPRENVVRFLATESRFSNNRSFMRRSRVLRGRP